MPRLLPLLLLLLLPLTPLGAAHTRTPEPPSAEQAQGKYWVTASTGKTHNSSCRYYKTSRGYHSSTGTGINCGICGGARPATLMTRKNYTNNFTKTLRNTPTH